MQRTLRVATFNIHKGVTSFNARLALQQQRELIRTLHADVVFLQEVRDAHVKHLRRFKHNWPVEGQAQFFGSGIGAFAYGKNAVYPDGHHGNAILSHYPIDHSVNHDISAHEIEQRGLLHCTMTIPHWNVPLHGICVHLGLLAHWRKKQFAALRDYIQTTIPEHEPLIIAGDFNDWRLQAGKSVLEELNLHEVFEQHSGKPARSYPSVLPVLRLDRIYTRGFKIVSAHVHNNMQFASVSDHAALSAVLEKN